MDLPTLQSIELPCFCDTATAMRLMGSQALVHSCVAQRSPELLLQLRPKDKLAHPIVGKPQSSPGLLVKVRRKRGSSQEEQVQILGKIETAYRFRSLADFQFLPSTTAAKGEAIVDTTQEVLETPPAIFIRNAPPPNVFKPQKVTQQKIKPERKVVVVKFGHAIPTEPPVDKTRRRKMQKYESTQQGLHLLFSSRPLWQRRLLNSYPVFARQLNMLHDCLPYAAFTFSSGPWAITWCRFGYNATRHPDACIYQVMQVRIKRRMLEELCEAIQEAVQATVAAGGVPALDTEIGYRAIEADLDNNRVMLTPNSTAGQDELLAGTVKLTLFGCEVKQQVNYQLCDVDDDDVLQYLSTIELLPLCDVKSGWFHESTIDGVRKRILQSLQRRVKKLVHAVTQAPAEAIVVRTASPAKPEEQPPEEWLAKFTTLAQRYASTVAGGGLDPTGGREETAVEGLPVIESDHEEQAEEGDGEGDDEAEEGVTPGKKPRKSTAKSKAATKASKRASKRVRTSSSSSPQQKQPPSQPPRQRRVQPPQRQQQRSQGAEGEETRADTSSISLPGLEPMVAALPGLSFATAVEGARPFEIFGQGGSDSEFYPESEEDMSESDYED